MFPKQATNISRAARWLLTDLEQVLGVTTTEAIEQQALQLITDAFERAAPLYLGERFAVSRAALGITHHSAGVCDCESGET